MEVVPVCCLMLFNDAHALGQESEALIAPSQDAEASEVANDDTVALSPSAVWVPWIMLGADIMAGLASGMTIKFFPVRVHTWIATASNVHHGIGVVSQGSGPRPSADECSAGSHPTGDRSRSLCLPALLPRAWPRAKLPCVSQHGRGVAAVDGAAGVHMEGSMGAARVYRPHCADKLRLPSAAEHSHGLCTKITVMGSVAWVEKHGIC